LNPSRRRGKPATNRLSYGAATALLAVCLLLFSSDLDYAIRTTEENKKVFGLNEAHHLLLNSDYNILFTENIYL
jgi:hypothetical protein